MKLKYFLIPFFVFGALCGAAALVLCIHSGEWGYVVINALATPMNIFGAYLVAEEANK